MVEAVKSKTNTLRSYFSKEYALIKQAKSGAGTDEVYESKWEFFKPLLFLKDSIKPRKTHSNLVSILFM